MSPAPSFDPDEAFAVATDRASAFLFGLVGFCLFSATVLLSTGLILLWVLP